MTPIEAIGTKSGSRLGLLLILGALALLVPLIGVGVIMLHTGGTERDALADLDAIAGLKAGQVENWLTVRNGNAAVLSANVDFLGHVAAILRSDDAGARKSVQDRLVAVRKAYGYDAIELRDVRGRLLLGVGDDGGNGALSREAVALIPQAVADGRLRRTELHLSAPGRIRLEFVQPLPGVGAIATQAVLVLRLNPERFLYPLIKVWPTSSLSGETLLVRRVGEEVVFLNELRHQSGSALSLRFPLSDAQNTRMIAATALLAGGTGTSAGMDYRGVPVLAAYRPVEGTDWVIVAKRDRSEILGPLYRLAAWTSLIALFAVVAVGIALLSLWRQQQRLQQLALRFQSEQLFKWFYDMPFIGMATTSPASKGWLQFNDRLCTILGYTREEFASKTWAELTHPEDLYKDVVEFERMLRGESDGYLMEKRFISKNGAVIYVDMDVRCVRDQEGRVQSFLGTIEDKTERKLMENEQRALTERALRQREALVGMMGYNSLSSAELGSAVRKITESAAATLGVTRVSVWRYNPERTAIRCMDLYEPASDQHSEGGEIRADCHPAYFTAIQDEKGMAAHDALHDPRTNELAQDYLRPLGITSMLDVPIHFGGKLDGVLCNEHIGPARQWTEDEIVFAVAVGARISIVLEGWERKRVADLLQEKSERLNGILGSIDQVIWSIDPQTHKVLYLSQTVEAIYGRPLQSFFDEPMLWLDVVLPDDRKTALDADRQIRESGRGSSEVRIQRPDGETRWVSNRGWLVRDETGKVLRMDGVVSDISEAKHAQLQLQESEDRLRGLVDQVISGIYIIQAGKLVFVNRRFAEFCGYANPEDMIGIEALSMIAEPEREKVSVRLQRHFEGGEKTAHYTTLALRRDGSTFDLGVHGTIATYDGRPAIIGMAQDISEKKRAEDKAERYLQQLQKAFMRTVEVATTISEMRDPYTAGHEKRVAQIAIAIGKEFDFDAQRLEGLRVAGYLHDVGKITIPSEILAKPGKLSAIEYQLIKGHAQASYDILKDVEFPWPVAQVVLQHHERMDGSGYPQGLKGQTILLEARIMAVADTVEAMSSHRPYRPGLGIDKALAEIERGSGTAYDENVADACLRLFREKGYVLPD